MAQKLPLSIISGFLGSGKTSLLNHLLSHANREAEGRKITALVNDFGALNIDAELISAQNGSQIELANGCVCCSIGDDLMQTLVAIMRAPERPDHIVIEASGVADPARIAAYAAIDPDLRLDGIISLVDATAHHMHKDDPHLADNYHCQIAAAHMLVISKPDLVDADAVQNLHDELAATCPDVPIIDAVHGAVPLNLLLGLKGDAPNMDNSEPLRDHGLESRAFHMLGLSDRDILAENLLSLHPELLRAKGVLTDSDGAYVIHYAGGRVMTEPFDGKPSGHFVLIGKPGLPEQADLLVLFGDLEAA